jgi:deoxyribodipyrimidine photo-lyase
VEFIHAALDEMQYSLIKLGSSLEVLYATPVEAFAQLIEKYTIEKVFTNHDYEPYARERDALLHLY